MKHVTDERTDRALGPGLHAWIEETIGQLPDGAELPPSIRSHVLSRLPGTPQRRRWWPTRWFPFGIGATRSAGSERPHPEGRHKVMFTATRFAAAIAILALAGSLALVTAPLSDLTSEPDAEAPAVDPARYGGVEGTFRLLAGGGSGDYTITAWGAETHGATWMGDLDVDDPRLSGSSQGTFNSVFYNGGPEQGISSGSVVITTPGGTWQGTSVGYEHPATQELLVQMQLAGAGAHDGLSALLSLSQDGAGSLTYRARGVIFPGTLPEYPQPPASGQ